MVTQEQTAKAKIRALAQGVRVYVLEPGIRYVVPSCSDDGTAYEIHVHLSGDIDCNCKAGVHGRPCKHLAAVQMRVEAEKDIQSAQQSNTGYRTCQPIRLPSLAVALSATKSLARSAAL